MRSDLCITNLCVKKSSKGRQHVSSLFFKLTRRNEISFSVTKKAVHDALRVEAISLDLHLILLTWHR